MTRVDFSPLLADDPVIAVLRADHAREYPPVIDALLAGGVRAIELTLSTAGVFAQIKSLAAEFGDAVIGLGTVTTAAQAETAIENGAKFIVSPTAELDVIRVACDAGVPVFPGGLTPTELYRCWEAGASALKLFPASVVGPRYIADISGPFPDMRIIPSGGVGLDDVEAWIAAGAPAVSIGGPLLGDAFSGGDLIALSTRAQQFRTIAGDALAQRKAVQ
ncbi:bifunctional 4-hydroxy-2-oxoglutarate aldolase/2-dehydro-3-deoxy-phosphogluconate aldolase [Mycobacterium neglectum]|uniref:bifunctional 4-hydroxy-2-oxoglutarate aldolase/2-dehydro-3-deoxy-phosphogluconate aldolase n=1 Tax=Mycobacterium neglectum TaxID=242737 RepID=UPI001FEC289F|nr:bifunctional 4-hydroxy-2-oxoglutarate aldolase/2-dehydro-3-deoxy-phosphogluconate aldolase [Mycobacterium neglectum]